MAAGAFAQQPAPWSEQLPGPQRPGQYPGPNSGPGPNAGPSDDQGDAPDRGVARVSFMAGNVSVRRGDSGDLVAAIVNAPLTAGDRIVTAGDGRAEVQFDSANLIRIGPSSEIRLSELEYHRYQIQVAAGTTIFRVVRQTDAQVEISTPSVAMHPLQPGVYRVGVGPDGASEITVRIGDAEVFSPRGSEPLHAGKTMMARGSATDPEFQLVNAVAQDEFEHWCISRDALLAQSQSQRPSSRYVNPDITGAEDLDANGRWVNDGTNGNVWVPTVDPGWAPYSCGRWVWTDFYGWTWVGCESWGWAPYHYGRWYYGGLGWAWWPGPFVGRYYWHPALVGFFGWGAPGIGVGFGFGFGFGHVGWVPLAPFEAFHPWYGRGFYGGGFRGAGVVNNINVVNTFHNARFTNAVSSVRAGDFGRGAIGSANMVRAPASELARAGMVRGQLPVAPSRESTQFSSRAASAQGLPRTSENTGFASHMAASQSNRVPFETQRSSMTRGTGGNSGGPGGGNPGSGNPGSFNGGARPGGAGSSAGGAGSNSGWRSFDPSNRGAGANATTGAGGGGGIRPSSQPNAGAPGSNGASNNAAGRVTNDGGWRSYDGGNRGATPQPQNRPESQPRSYTPQPQPQPRGYSQQPVRINPSIVQNRGNSGSPAGSGGSGGNSRPSNSGASHSGGNAGHSGGGHGHK